MKKRIVLFSVLFLLLVSFVSAAIVAHPSEGSKDSDSFSISYETVTDSIFLGEKAEFEIIITNNLPNTTIDLDLDFANTGEWLPIRTDPLYHGLTGIEVKPDSSESSLIVIKPRDTTGVGAYVVELVVSIKGSDEKVSVLLPVSIKSSSEIKGEYLPNIMATVEVPEKIDPREEYEILIILKNNNFREITNLTINIESELLGKKTIINSLGPNEAKTIKIPLPIDELQEPTSDLVYAVVYADNYQFTPSVKKFNVIDYTEELTKNIIEKKSFFKDKKIITFTNDGNVKRGEQYKLEKSWFERLFTFSSQDPQVIEEDGKKLISWYYELEPTKSAQLTTSTNYRPLFYVILLIVISVLLHFLFKSPIIVTKRFTNVETKEGGLSNMKILLNIKNTGNKRIKDFEVIDRIPHIADIKQEFEVGTLKPYKILKHRRKGTIVKWKIDELEGSEERIINYEIKSKLSILGNFRLLPTVVKYKTDGGRGVVVRSNSLLIPKTSD